jgi:putative membrane protein
VIRIIYLRVTNTLAQHSIVGLLLMHAVGILGMISPFQTYFRLLTPVNLLICGFLLYLNHRDANRNFFAFAAFTFVFGFLVEFLGVNYGFFFGDYSYGKTLGPKLLNVPIIIGLNWLLIIYCVATLTDSLRIPTVVKIFLGAALAVFIDWLIEPVAMRYDFWSWANDTVPLQNYIGWFFTSLVMMTAYHLLRVNSENRIALPYYFIQLGFFLVLNVYLLLR